MMLVLPRLALEQVQVQENNGNENVSESENNCSLTRRTSRLQFPEVGSSASSTSSSSSRSTARSAVTAVRNLERKGWAVQTPRSMEDLERLIREIELCDSLPDPPKPRLPELSMALSAMVRIQRIQKYIESFEYNHTGTNYFKIRKDLGFKRLVTISNQIMNECLPIKCIEATILGACLTASMSDIVRIPIRIESAFPDQKVRYRHIVLAVKTANKWGAIGLSRKSTLMDKPVEFSSLSALLENFRDSYHDLGQQVRHVGIGLPFPRDQFSSATLYWRPLMIFFRPGSAEWDVKTNEAIDLFYEKSQVIETYVRSHDGDLPNWYCSRFPNVRKPKESSDSSSDSDSGGKDMEESETKTKK